MENGLQKNKIMGISDFSINRVYACTNQDCKCQLAIQQKVSDKWRKKCPFCHKMSLVLESACMNLSTMIDTKVPKTLGSMSQHNRKRDEIEKGVEPSKPKPFWRSKQKINYEVLKNPQKYIATGHV